MEQSRKPAADVFGIQRERRSRDGHCRGRAVSASRKAKSQLKLLADTGKEGAPRGESRGKGADRGAAAQKIDLVQDIDHIEAELDDTGLGRLETMGDAEIDLLP